jgi:ribosomal protein S18 acetylase RimI-like enzyme
MEGVPLGTPGCARREQCRCQLAVVVLPKATAPQTALAVAFHVMGLQIRDVGREDAAGLAKVQVAAWMAVYRGLISDAFLDGMNVEEWEARWSERLSEDGLPPVRVAVRDNTIVGFTRLAIPSRDQDAAEDVAEVAAINVDPDAWRAGIGTALMHDAFKRLRREGWRAVTLWVVEGNQRAEAFYKRLGFTYEGATQAHEAMGATLLRMHLDLPALD